MLTQEELAAIPDITAPPDLAEILDTAGVAVPLEVVERWDAATRLECADWAFRIILDDPPHPPRPPVLALFADEG